ncbi:MULTISPECIES: Holliday junction branch migration protein RuvA [Methylocaldum]|jgi:Holliday junction DNA helicase RuvA|uniref:Holliday junction branch migration protein RuvA n=1 Tax=unclassified Methylocaldum TaxID=2622260 RepID=UPI000A32987D|nr:Holliday junction branch migration protein RuvA [Methylocaldum sp. RMAD-M]MBP1148743.1 Holliday junction DNA helicase RuvA [Methylocaldum sp. RMAD-M]MDV3240262.1 Holliday junction branch migration protein RuvA [Methylocaldum sp.]MVF20789.1 Holliday junction branch migration protein RuvA [Methylocaldum sp. BRCS4]
MIGFLRGLVVAKKPPSLLLDVRGVGYEIDAPMSTFYKLPEIGEEVTLYTHLAIREDAHSLFGFVSEAERALFRSLIRVSGVGAKLALAILSGLSAEEFHRCVEAQDAARLVRLPGVGKKTAERLIIEMRDRLPELPTVHLPGAGTLPAPAASPVDDAVSALIALGFKPQDASNLVRKVPVDGKSSEEIIRSALQSAAK